MLIQHRQHHLFALLRLHPQNQHRHRHRWGIRQRHLKHYHLHCLVLPYQRRQFEQHQNFLPNDAEGGGREDVKYSDSCLLSDKNEVRSA